MSETRKQFLKMYLFALLSEGQFSGALTPTTLGKKALAAFVSDLPGVAEDILQMLIDQGGSQTSTFVLGKLKDIASDVAKRGPRAVWNDVQAQHKRGMDAIAKRK